MRLTKFQVNSLNRLFILVILDLLFMLSTYNNLLIINQFSGAFSYCKQLDLSKTEEFKPTFQTIHLRPKTPLLTILRSCDHCNIPTP